jgi:hypothetical protein
LLVANLFIRPCQQVRAINAENSPEQNSGRSPLLGDRRAAEQACSFRYGFGYRRQYGTAYLIFFASISPF